MTREFFPLESRATLFSTISTIDRIVHNFKEGKLAPNLYKKQLNALIRDYYDLTTSLSRRGFNVNRFYEEERIRDRFPQALERINSKQMVSEAPHPKESIAIQSTAQKMNIRLAALTAKLVSGYITIGDSARLKIVATKEMLVPLFDECLLVLSKLPIFNEKYWVTPEITAWREILQGMDLKKPLSDSDAEKLAYNADRWLKDLQLRLELEIDR